MTITISTGLIEQGLSDNAPGTGARLIHKIHGPCPDNEGGQQAPGWPSGLWSASWRVRWLVLSL